MMTPMPSAPPLPRPEQHTDTDGRPIWHTASVEDVIAHLATASRGLSSGEAAQRLQIHGPNELTSVARESAWRTLAAQFKNALIVILLCATVISGFLGHTLEAIVITVIVLFAVLLGFFQEYRASRALDALRQMAAPTARVRRDGEEIVVPARDLVPGDIVVLRAGDRVPADIRLTQSVNLAVDEAALTGESQPAQKTIDPFEDPRLPLGDRRNMAYAGTMVSYGRGAGSGRLDRHVNRVRAHCPNGGDRRSHPHTAAGEPRSAGWHARQGGTGRRRRWSSPLVCCAACR